MPKFLTDFLSKFRETETDKRGDSVDPDDVSDQYQSSHSIIDNLRAKFNVFPFPFVEGSVLL